MNVSILGGGAFGSALAIHFAKKNYDVKVWEYFEEAANKMQNTRICEVLNNINLPANILITSKLSEALSKDTEVVFLVVSSINLEETYKKALEFITPNQRIIICSKGFAENQRLLSDVIKDNSKNPVYCLYGPTIAQEVADEKLTGMVLAGTKDEELKSALESDYLKIDLSDDLIGVQVASALKNVVTIMVGIVEGLECGDNTKSFVFVRGLKDIENIGLALGANKESFYSLTGLGDLLLHSRNRNLGIEIGKGKTLEEALDGKVHVSEGVIACKNAIELAKKLNLKIPVIEALSQIMFEKKDALGVIKNII